MSGRCTDNPVLGIIGCGAVYGGELQHSVARVPWSTQPDGRAHFTATLHTVDRCWAKGKEFPADPATLGFHQDDRGVWRKPADDRSRARVAAHRAAEAAANAQTAPQTVQGYPDGPGYESDAYLDTSRPQ